MSITRSYNKYTNTYYAYDTTYEWDDKAQKKVQRKRCIGKFDPETGEVIPTGKRGRPAKSAVMQDKSNSFPYSTQDLENLKAEAAALYAGIDAIEALVSKAEEEVQKLRASVDRFQQKIEISNKE